MQRILGVNLHELSVSTDNDYFYPYGKRREKELTWGGAFLLLGLSNSAYVEVRAKLGSSECGREPDI